MAGSVIRPLHRSVDGMHVGEPALPDHFNSLLTQAELFIFRL
jgi:hypothetical protein